MPFLSPDYANPTPCGCKHPGVMEGPRPGFRFVLPTSPPRHLPLHTNPLFTSGRSAVRFLCLGADPGAVPAHVSLSIYALMEQTKRLSDRATWRSCVVQHLPVTRSIVYRYLDRSSATVATREGRYCILFLDRDALNFK